MLVLSLVSEFGWIEGAFIAAAIVDIRFMALPWLRKKFNHV